MSNENIKKIELEDFVIMENDKNGEETLRLAIEAEGRQVKFRFPRWGKWDRYADDMYSLMLALSVTVEDIEISNISDFDLEKFSHWSTLLCSALQYRKVSETVEKIFFTYLNPKVKGVLWFRTRAWCKRNLGMDAVFQMFIAILFVDDFIKKKAKLSLQKMLQKVTQQQSTLASMKKPDGLQNESIGLAHSKSVSF